MDNITLKQVASAFKGNYQRYNIPIIDKDFLNKSLDHVKKDILATLINISSNFDRFIANIMLEIDCSIIESEPLEIKYGNVDINDIDKLIIDRLQKYEELLESTYMRSAYYNPNKENKILIVFDDMIADMINDKKLNSILTELFIRSRKLNISLVFITQSYFKVPKNVRNNSTHFFIMKIPNKRKLQQIAINHSLDINTGDFIEIYRKCTDKPYLFLVIDTTLPSSNRLRFRKNLNIMNDDNQ